MRLCKRTALIFYDLSIVSKYEKYFNKGQKRFTHSRQASELNAASRFQYDMIGFSRGYELINMKITTTPGPASNLTNS